MSSEDTHRNAPETKGPLRSLEGGLKESESLQVLLESFSGDNEWHKQLDRFKLTPVLGLEQKSVEYVALTVEEQLKELREVLDRTHFYLDETIFTLR
jgi:hypothetical protein